MAYGARFSRYFLDVKILPSHPIRQVMPENSVEALKYQESSECLKYEQRIIDIEKSNASAFLLGGAGLLATRPLKQLASKFAEKKDESYYSDAITYIRTRISFALLRSAII